MLITFLHVVVMLLVLSRLYVQWNGAIMNRKGAMLNGGIAELCHVYYVSYKISGAVDDARYSQLRGIVAFGIAAFHCIYLFFPSFKKFVQYFCPWPFNQFKICNPSQT